MSGREMLDFVCVLLLAAVGLLIFFSTIWLGVKICVWIREAIEDLLIEIEFRKHRKQIEKEAEKDR